MSKTSSIEKELANTDPDSTTAIKINGLQILSSGTVKVTNGMFYQLP